MLPLIGRTAVISTLCVAIGAHWFVLQSIAWGAMISRYSQEMPLAVAISQTFDGSHPCDLCKHISSARKSEKKQDAQAGPVKPDLICVARPLALLPRRRNFEYAPFALTSATFALSPPTPPPRSQRA